MCFVNSTDCKSVASAADAAAAVCQYALFRKIPAITVGAGLQVGADGDLLGRGWGSRRRRRFGA